MAALPPRDDHSSGTSVAERLTLPTRTAGPETGLGLCPAPSLFGIAPGGVYHAGPVAGPAVGSYPTLSPLPPPTEASGAVCFLRHFPWGYPRRTLSGTVFPWSPDFPPRQPCGLPERPSGQLTCQGDGIADRPGQAKHDLPVSHASLLRPCCNNRGSSVWCHGRRCIAIAFHIVNRQPARGPCRDTSCPIECWSRDHKVL
jgi:hypothetical protein